MSTQPECRSTFRPSRGAAWGASIAGLVALVFNAPATAQQEGRQDTLLSLAAALELTLEQSPALQAERAAATSAAFAASAARRLRVPTLQFSGGYLYSPVEDRRLIPRVSFADLSRDQIFNQHIADAGAQLIIPLFTGGELTRRAEVAEAVADGAEARARFAQDGLLFRTAAKYYEILQRRRSVRATEGSIASLLETRRIVQQKLDVGRAAPVELFRINTRLANVQLDLLSERNGLAKALADLEAFVGVRLPVRDYTLTDTLHLAPMQVDLDSLIQLALEVRPEMDAARAAVVREQARVGVATSQYLPRVAVVGSVSGNVGDNVGEIRGDAFAAVRVSLPIFKTSISAQANEARAARAAAQRRLEQLQLDIALDVERAVLDLREASDRVQVAQTSLAEAEEARRIEQLRFYQGRATINDVLDAEAELLRADLGLAAALAAHGRAVAAVRRAVGNLTPQNLAR